MIQKLKQINLCYTISQAWIEFFAPITKSHRENVNIILLHQLIYFIFLVKSASLFFGPTFFYYVK